MPDSGLSPLLQAAIEHSKSARANAATNEGVQISFRLEPDQAEALEYFAAFFELKSRAAASRFIVKAALAEFNDYANALPTPEADYG